jgi:threonine/homoserine/homoserine lactone efflux protein
MPELLPAWPLLTAFVSASLLLAITPGPGVLYIVTRSLVQGRRAGLASVGGVALGNLANAIGAAIGLAALFAVSSTAFLIIKYLGAAYLLYLGIRALRGAAGEPQTGASKNRQRHVFRDGLWVALLNPKTTLFFAAFLPQFMDAGANPMLQGIALGVLFVIIAGVTDSIYALAAGSVGPTIGRSSTLRTTGRYLSGVTFIGLGIFAALSGDTGKRQIPSR